ncbi:GntR family transcriptional regulator [Klugiella xanthotipulae]|uniref:GntR family transcriptional regulator n=1 Tax=Klugiella xanthotipulae TaxID=244735 RepID=A0A543HXX3_9MICO|nr:GntR family transcriptional regulator [Klugiella xanthotipulae]TQM63196.1 GntR family transcriptional regulator [Klugiella xanthotipulae]
MKPRVSATSIVDAVAEDLRNRLYAAEFPGGTAFTENDVAQTYEVARPTAKAAIEKVVAEGLLVRGVHKTARVPELGPEDVRDIYRSRAYLETEVLRRLAARGTVPTAAVRANREIAEALDSENALAIVEPDMRFHTSLIDALGSPRTSKLYGTLVSEVRICMTQVQGRRLLDPKIICAEHDQILTYIRQGDGDAVARLLDEHLARARERLVAAVGGEAGPEALLPFSVEIPPH